MNITINLTLPNITLMDKLVRKDHDEEDEAVEEGEPNEYDHERQQSLTELLNSAR